MKLIKTEEIKCCQYCDTPNGSSTDDKSGKEFCLLVHYWKSSSLLYCITSNAVNTVIHQTGVPQMTNLEKNFVSWCIIVLSSSLLYCITSYLSKAPLMAEPLRSAARALEKK